MINLMTSFRKRMALVMIFFSIAPILFFGLYAYENLSEQRRDTYEKGFYYTFSNDLKGLNIWLESRKLTLISDGKLHFLSDKKNRKSGIREGRQYQIIKEGDEEYNLLLAELKTKNSNQILTKFVHFNSTQKIVDERTVLYVYAKDFNSKLGLNYFIKEEIHLKELITAVESILNDQFITYSIFVNQEILFTQNKQELLDPYDAYYNRNSFTTVSNREHQYMGIYEGDDATNIHVAVFRDYSQAITQIRNYQNGFLVKVFIVAIFGMMISIILSRKINYPIHTVKVAVENILNGDIESRIQVSYKDEFGQIYESFNQLAEIETSNYKEILESGNVVSKKNRQLIELNSELEVSYEQLRNAMDLLGVSKNKHEALINNIGELIWTMDEDGIITFVNQSVEDKLGYPAELFVGYPLKQFILELESGDSVETFVEQMQCVDLSNVSVYFSKNNTEDRAFMMVNTKRIMENNFLKSIQGFARNITDDWILHHMTLRRNKEMDITGQISWVLANNILLDELLEEIVKKIEQLLHPDLCFIGLMEDSEAVIYKIGGFYKQQIGSVKLAISSELLAELLEKQKIVRGEALYQSFRVANESIYASIQDYVILSLRFDQKIIGFFTIASSKKMSDSDLKVLQIIANQSAIAIDKAQLYKTLKEEYLNTIRVLATAVEVKDAYTEGHSFRVSKMGKLIAEKLSNSEKYIEEIEISGILHDIGKIGIFDKILTKKGKLSDEEFRAIQQHPAIGYKIITPINLSQPIIDGILLHHKRFDLKGYPTEIEIDELPLAAGIIGVADAVDAMTSTRSYSGAKDIAVAMLEVEKHSGTQFHPGAASAILAIFRDNPEKLLQIINEEL